MSFDQATIDYYARAAPHYTASTALPIVGNDEPLLRIGPITAPLND